MSDPQRPPHIQRCTYQEVRGERAWQCKLTDPHEGVQHDLPIDAEFSRDLDRAPAVWLAATLRDQVARRRHAQRRVDDLTAVASQLAAAWAGSAPRYGWELPDLAADWLRANAPTAAEQLGLGA